MDTTQLLYLAGAFLLGFFFAWFAGRSGPKHALEECEANAHSLQRSLDDSARSVAKLEGQLKEQVVQVDRLGTEKAVVAAQIAVFEQSAADSGAELAQIQQQLNESQSERLRLETELGHIRDAYADTRSRLVELTQQAEADKVAAETEAEEEAAAVEELIEDTSTALALAEASHTADLELLTGQVRSLETELSAARAALSRLSAQVALRPELTPGKRQEYAALAGDPDRIIAALHERDVAVVDARGEVDYLRRTIGMLTAMGAELANEVERRRREQQLLVYQVAGLTAVTRNVEMKQLEDTQAAAPAQADLAIKSEELESLETRYAATNAVAAELQTQLEERSKAAAELQIQLDERSKEFEALKSESGPLQANLDELQAQIEALNAAQADLEAQLEAHDAELTETKDKLATLQTDAESTAAAKAGLEQQLQAQSSEWDGLLARINALNDELAGITAGEPAEEAAPAEPAASAEPAAPSDEVAALATPSEAAESTAKVVPEAARAADAAIPVAAEQATEQAVEPSPDSAPVKKEETPANAALAKLSAGVAAAVALFKRKNAKLAEYDQQVNVLAGDKSTLESTVAAKDQALVSTQGKVEELQTAMSQRSARFDALSMHASSLEAEMEIRQLDRNQLEEQVRRVAADLQELTATYAANGAASGAAAEPAPDATVAAAGEAAAATLAVETPAAEAAPVAAEVEASSIDALNASAVAVVELVRSKQSTLEDAKTQLAELQEQLETYSAAKDALAAELESRGLSLSDVQTQLESLQGDYAGEQGARGELENKLQELDGQLQGYLAEYGDPEDVAQPAEAPAPDAAAQGDAATAADAGESAPAKKVGAAASVAALGTVLKRRKDAFESASAQIAELENQISLLTSEKSELESQVQQKEQALADLTAQYETTQADVATLTTDVETLKNQLDASQAELTATEEERQRLAAQLNELNNDLASLATAWEAGDEESVSAIAEKLIGPAPETGGESQPAEGEAVNGHDNGETTRSMAVPLAKTAGAVAVAGAIRNKQLALKETSARLDSVQQEQAALTTAKADLETQYQSQTAALEEAKAQLEALQGEYAGEQGARGELESKLQEVDSQLQAYLAEFGDAEDTAQPAAAVAEGAEGSGETAPAKKVGAAASVVALGTVLKRRKDALESASAQVTELENQINALTSEKSDLESQVQQKEQALADLTAQHEAVQAELTATEEERQRLQAELDQLNSDLASLATAWEAGDEESVSAIAEKLIGPAVETSAETGGEATRSMAVPLAKTAGAVAVAGAIRNKQLALKETSAQLDSVQQEQAALTTAKADLETQYQSQTAALEEAKAQLEALQQQIDAANVAHAEELQVIDQKTAELQAQYNEAETTRLQLQAQVDELTADQDAAKALLAERDSAVQEAETKLEAITLPAEKTTSDFKAAARAAAEARGVEVHSTADVQDLSLLKHIGVTFEQRLYRAGAGTFWEVAHMTDDDFELVLRLTEMQQLAMDMNEVRSDAVRLAEETGSVGLLSEGETPDDFEPIQGIGKIFEQRLYSAGIRTYRELANTSEERLAEICQARKPLVPDYGSWVRQARDFLESRGEQ